ncbi:MAG: ABC transporter ATP-binding protein [Mobilicoccus sp.]|nr:ABC transporter ATP-binding protein [Mobilicoccus sp.]
MPSPAVLVDGLCRRFGPVVAVQDMSWQAHHGRVTAVLGPNGAGKTTTVACLEGLLRADAGVVRVLDTDPWGADADHRARVGVMLQDGGLQNMSTPARLLPHLARFHTDPWDPGDLMRRLDIGPFARTIVRRLSGGQRQRVALAAALVGRPEVVFLDEPSAGLDPHGRLDVWDLVREVAESGTCVVLTTHSFEEADRLADDVVVVARGRAVATGTVAEVAGDAGLEETYFSLTRPSKEHP